ncbi:adenosine 3'-phospho 5'-phosphosulfate transporter 2 isoform 2 [Planoprotostelium fungivorum]|uniref:Adenosine 3'-phospho 5'-phosphosulfate transporter 2 isoform 2 n=1 Tax=Planoprotostelium fungivorum TaxID=1890364 RepID=A0A2P6NYF8_9EUKA|nr:adenosine 3'-phospho 5'-phosphosulfate transporter 2 isoform 2 [Planoprotostelium fungivorum]
MSGVTALILVFVSLACGVLYDIQPQPAPPSGSRTQSWSDGQNLYVFTQTGNQNELWRYTNSTWSSIADNIASIPAEDALTWIDPEQGQLVAISLNTTQADVWVFNISTSKLVSNANSSLLENNFLITPGELSQNLNITLPTVLPTSLNISLPTVLPTSLNITLPTVLPTSLNITLPTILPTSLNITLPTSLNISLPTVLPTDLNITLPNILPTDLNITLPTVLPTSLNVTLPTVLPTELNVTLPTVLPTDLNITLPTVLPTSLNITLPTELNVTVPDITSVLNVTLPTVLPTILNVTVPDITSVLNVTLPDVPTVINITLPTSLNVTLPTVLPTSLNVTLPTVLPTSLNLTILDITAGLNGTLPDAPTAINITLPDVTPVVNVTVPDITAVVNVTLPDVTSVINVTVPDITSINVTVPDVTSVANVTVPDITAVVNVTVPDVTSAIDVTVPDVTSVVNATVPDVTSVVNATVPDVTSIVNDSASIITSVINVTKLLTTSQILTTSKLPLTTLSTRTSLSGVSLKHTDDPSSTVDLVSTTPSPDTTVQTPSTGVPAPSTSAQAPSTSAQAPSTSVQAPSTSVQTPSTSVQAPSTSVQTPSTSVQAPSTSVQAPSTSAQTPSTSVQTPSTTTSVVGGAVGSLSKRSLLETAQKVASSVSPLTLSKAVVFAENSSSVWVIGGKELLGGSVSSAVHHFSNKRWEIVNTTNSVDGFYQAASFYNATSRVVTIIGGFNSSNSIVNTVRTLDLNRLVWSHTKGPEAKAGSALVGDQRGKLYLYGGYAPNVITQELWVSNSTGNWTAQGRSMTGPGDLLTMETFTATLGEANSVIFTSSKLVDRLRVYTDKLGYNIGKSCLSSAVCGGYCIDQICSIGCPNTSLCLTSTTGLISFDNLQRAVDYAANDSSLLLQFLKAVANVDGTILSNTSTALCQQVRTLTSNFSLTLPYLASPLSVECPAPFTVSDVSTLLSGNVTLSNGVSAKILDTFNTSTKPQEFYTNVQALTLRLVAQESVSSLVTPYVAIGNSISIIIKSANTPAEASISPSLSGYKAGFSIPSEVVGSLLEFARPIVAVLSVMHSSPLQQSEQNLTFVGDVVGLSVYTDNGTEISVKNTSKPISIQIGLSPNNYNLSDLQCVWWSENETKWSPEGCTIHPTPGLDGTASCDCNHLTNFTVTKIPTPNSQPTINTASAPTGAIVGGVIGGIAAICLVVVAAIIVARRQQHHIDPAIRASQFAESEANLDSSIITMVTQEDERGEAFKATYSDTTTVALKKLMTEEDRSDFMRESIVLRSLHHPNLVQFLGLWSSDVDTFMVTEYFVDSNAREFLLKHGDIFNNRNLLQMVKDICGSVCYLESMGIVHCDIRSENVMVRPQNGGRLETKLGGFSHALVGFAPKPSQKILSDFAVRWAAPQVILNKKYSHASDVWSFGVFLWEVMNGGKTPYEGMNDAQIVDTVVDNKGHPSIPQTISALSDLMSSCWSYKPSSRPNMRHIADTLSQIIDPNSAPAPNGLGRSLVRRDRLQNEAPRVDKKNFLLMTPSQMSLLVQENETPSQRYDTDALEMEPMDESGALQMNPLCDMPPSVIEVQRLATNQEILGSIPSRGFFCSVLSPRVPVVEQNCCLYNHLRRNYENIPKYSLQRHLCLQLVKSRGRREGRRMTGRSSSDLSKLMRPRQNPLPSDGQPGWSEWFSMLSPKMTRRSEESDSPQIMALSPDITGIIHRSHQSDDDGDLLPTTNGGTIPNTISSNLLFGVLDLSQFLPRTQFLICVFGIFGFFLPYGLLQERLFRLQDFHYGLFITFLQYVTYLMLSYTERQLTGDTIARAKWTDYAKISVFIVSSLALSNLSLSYLSFPTKVLFKSSKIIPLMLVGRFFFGKRYTFMQYIASVLLLLSVILFSLGDAAIRDNPVVIGVLLQCCSIACESMGQNLQDAVMSRYHCTEREMIFYQSMIGAPLVCTGLIVTGLLFPALTYSRQVPQVYYLTFMIALCGYAGGMFALNITRTCGIFVTVTVGTCRKLMTIVLSFLVFPKPFLLTYLFAGLFSVSGIFLNIYAKNQKECDDAIRRIFSSRNSGMKQSSMGRINVFQVYRLNHSAMLSWCFESSKLRMFHICKPVYSTTWNIPQICRTLNLLFFARSMQRHSVANANFAGNSISGEGQGGTISISGYYHRHHQQHFRI